MTSTERPVRHCGTMAVHRRLLTESAAYRSARAELENATIRLVSLERTSTEVVTIPVVVHVVHRIQAEDISDEQIRSQIDVLNLDYRATNPDVSTVPDVFADLVADARVQFELATVDPDGKPTDGITRTKTTRKDFTADDAVKSSATRGADAWPTDRYLNIWVCRLAGGLLGYAQFPGGPADTDGVVITYTAFGTLGTAKEPFHLGRTATHEVGHYLNLFHIWGDDGSGCGGTDEVDDTPNQGSENTGKPTFPKLSCSNGPNGDLFMDYMDYVDDDVMVMFTTGQVARMRACLDDARKALWTGA
ncbi:MULTISPECIES: M43 family zinc metalloprotease [unclassified Gordonia (in: high G+C Gram-positive bacteria)]|uniref:M43 family zinc metalloprotease n=1 Tax=Gordonia sp. B7-2 TaxID=3420932 RepID=UPI003D8EA520